VIFLIITTIFEVQKYLISPTYYYPTEPINHWYIVFISQIQNSTI